MSKKYNLDPSRRYNHGCTDFAVFEDRGDGTAICVEANSCTSCWQVGHDHNNVYAEVGEVVTVEYLLNHPDLVRDEEDELWETERF